MKTKICSSCNRELPANTDYYHKHSEKQYGLDNRCKECKGYKFTKKLQSKEGYKVCKECDIEKPISEFSKVGDSYGNLRATCKSCEYEKSKKYINICLYCSKKFKTHRNTQQFCSTSCEGKYIKENELRKGKNHWNWEGGEIETTCDYCGKKITQKKSQFEKFENHYCSRECNGKHAEETGRYIGENSVSYNPNLTDEDRVKRRKTPESKKWTRDVFDRDNYTCVVCGYRGKGLVAHHLNGYNWCKEERTKLENGVTLCKKHHKEFHKKYGYGNNTKKEFVEYMKLQNA